MNDDLFDGIWVFDREASTLGSMAPVAWIQSVYVEGDRIRVKEEIRRGDSWATVEVEGKLDGHYYPVVGSPFTDDMCFVMEGECIRGVARKNGVVALRDCRDFSEPGTMRAGVPRLRGGQGNLVRDGGFSEAGRCGCGGALS